MKFAPRLIAIILFLTCLAPAQFKPKEKPSTGPWMNTSLTADQRADLVIKEMTLDLYKIDHLLSKETIVGIGTHEPSIGEWQWWSGLCGGSSAARHSRYPDDATLQRRAQCGSRAGAYSDRPAHTPGAAASWDLEAAYDYGRLIGSELRAQGYNMSLGGGVNLTREPRNGRNFEYLGEDPILAGKLVGQLIRGTQSQHVLGDIKHYALNNQESGRNAVNVNIDERSMRETDLLAFEIGIRDGNPAGVMCSYNRLNGDYACENKYLLTDVLKKDWKFPGFAISDWGATHSTAKASAAGLDHEEPGEYFYGDRMKQALQAGQVSMAELDEHVHRIVRSMFATGLVDDPVEKMVVDADGGFEVAQRIAEQSMVLLKNQNNVLPLDVLKVKSIAVIGAHADVGMISGGGSAQVDPPGGNIIMPPGERRTVWGKAVWFPTSPLKNIRAKAPNAKVEFDPGTDPTSAAALAKHSDVAIVFVSRWETEGDDAPSLALPDNQDDLIAKVAAANLRTIVVLETGNPVSMPWVDHVSGILEAWFAGTRGAEALTNILFGEVNPSAKLPITFPKTEADLPHFNIVKPPQESTPRPRRAKDGRRSCWAFPLSRPPMTKASRSDTSGTTQKRNLSCFPSASACLTPPSTTPG